MLARFFKTCKLKRVLKKIKMKILFRHIFTHWRGKWNSGKIWGHVRSKQRLVHGMKGSITIAYRSADHAAHTVACCSLKRFSWGITECMLPRMCVLLLPECQSPKKNLSVSPHDKNSIYTCGSINTKLPQVLFFYLKQVPNWVELSEQRWYSTALEVIQRS